MKSPSDSSDLPTITKSEDKDCEPQIDQQTPAPAGGIEQEVHREGKRGRKDKDYPVRGPEDGDPKGQSGSPQKLPRKTRMRQRRPVKAVGQVLELPAVEKRKQGRGITKEQRAEIEARLLKAIPDDIPSVRIGPRGCPMLTEEHILIVETAISKGFPYAMAADLLGIAKSTLSEYLTRRPHVRERLKKAEALHITKHLELIDQASVKNWQASAWKLERRHREHFGQQQQVNVAGAVANVHFTAADAALIVAHNKAKFVGSSRTIDANPQISEGSIVGGEPHQKDKG